MIKITFLAFILTLSVLYSFSTETTITGNLPNAENLEIRLLVYSDQITYDELVLDRTIIDKNGFFLFNIDIKEPMISFFDIEFYSFILYLEPGGKYEINCDSISIDNQYRPYYKKEHLCCKITSDLKPGLNNLITEFNTLYNEFVINNFDEIYKKRKRSLIDSFKKEIEQKFKDIDNDYFQDYIEYKIASVELAGVSVKKPEIFLKYLDKKPVLYHNTEYMYFFNQFFEHYLTSGSKSISRTDLLSAINYQSSYAALMDTLGKDTLLRNEVIREMVMLKGLKELYYSPDYSRQNILDILKQVAASGKFPEHRLIANNLVITLTKLEKGTHTPNFKLPDLNGKMVELSELFGKPVYLSFITTWSYACLAEMKLMADLYNDHKNRIEFVSVSLDKNPEIVRKYVKDKGYEWIFLYNGSGYDLLKDYDIKTFPLFILINKKGEILQYPAYKPSENIETYFQALTKESDE